MACLFYYILSILYQEVYIFIHFLLQISSNSVHSFIVKLPNLFVINNLSKIVANKGLSRFKAWQILQLGDLLNKINDLL